jgi:hypothetical protein
MLLLLLVLQLAAALSADSRLGIEKLENLRLLPRLGDEREELLPDLGIVLVDKAEQELALPRKPFVYVVL